MPKKRVVTATKEMKFITTYGTENTREKQSHAEEREVKRWFQTRLDNVYKLAVKYDPKSADTIADVGRQIKGRDLMALARGHTAVWQYTYDDRVVTLAVERL